MKPEGIVVRGRFEVVVVLLRSLDVVLIEEMVLAGVRTLAAVVGAERYEFAGEFVDILSFYLRSGYMFLFPIYNSPMGTEVITVVTMPRAGVSSRVVLIAYTVCSVSLKIDFCIQPEYLVRAREKFKDCIIRKFQGCCRYVKVEAVDVRYE